MSEDTVVLESSAPAEVQTEAEAMGWIPPARFKGDPERFVDAEAYLEKGKEVLPILRATNDKLRRELTAVQTQQRETSAALKAAQEAIDNIEERHTVATARAVEKARVDVKAQLEEALKEGDHRGAAELTEQLTQLNAVDTEAPAVKKAPAAQPAAEVDPEVTRWVEESAPWYGTDRRKTALAMGIAQEIREVEPALKGRPFLDRVAEEVEKTLAPRRAAPVDRTESGRNGAGGESRSSGAKTFDALPAEAKAACQADTKRFVGPGKKYETAAQWHAAFANLYFQE